MSKTIKAEAPAKATKRYAPSRMEVFKTVLIAVLVTAIVAFGVGVKYANNQHAQVEQAVKAAKVVEPVAITEGK